MELPVHVTVVEVGPRDGLQNEPLFLETSLKIELINGLIRSGFTRIEATSFVHPNWIPQLKDAEEVIKGIKRPPHVVISALVPNFRGYIRARDCGVGEINMVLSASETHNIKNVNRTVKESLRDFRAIAEAAQRDGIMVRGSVATSFGCHYEGKVQIRSVLDIISELWAMGCNEIVLADTVGVANPLQVYSTFSEVSEKQPGVRLAAHFHDTRGMGMANVIAALQAGVSVFDSSVGGMGGCPYVPGASGNIATEDLVGMLSEMGIETGIHMDNLRNCVERLSGVMNHGFRGHMHGVWNNLRSNR